MERPAETLADLSIMITFKPRYSTVHTGNQGGQTRRAKTTSETNYG